MESKIEKPVGKAIRPFFLCLSIFPLDKAVSLVAKKITP